MSDRSGSGIGSETGGLTARCTSRDRPIRQEVHSLNRLFSLMALAALLTALLPSTNPVQAQSSSPDYGASVFLLGNPTTTARDLALVKKANLNWIKMAVPWRSIEPSCKNCIDWDDLDRVVLAASQAGLKILARVDHQPAWTRVTAVDNGPPDDI